MKSFRKILSEVAEPKAGDEKAFKDKHIVTKVDYPVDVEDQFTGGKTVKKAPKRRADHDVGEDSEVYEAMDPVNKKAAMGKFKDRADKDIDNDGDVDSSDKYLHARRKAITKAIHKEELNLSDFSVEEWEEFMESAEYEQLDEISKKTLGSYIKKATPSAMDHGVKGMDFKNDNQPKHFNKAMNRMTGIKRAADKLVAKEEVEELDEISRDTARSYIRKAMAHKTTGETPNKDRSAGVNLAGKKAYGIGGKAKINATESVEQLDELSPNTLHSYIKKAAGNMAGNAAVGAAQASSSMKKSSPDVKRNIRNRMRGITGASGRLADKANMAENAWEEVPMMMRQLQFIMFATEELMEYLDTQVDPEEWFQNKLAHIHDQMQTLQAYAEGDMRMMSKMDYRMYGEEAELDEAAPAYSATYIKNLKNTFGDKKSLSRTDVAKAKKIIDQSSNANIRQLAAAGIPHISDMAKTHLKNNLPGGMKKEEVELDESITKMTNGRLKFHMNTGTPHGSYTKDEMKAERDRRLKTDPIAYRSAKASINEVTQSAVKKTVTFTGSDGKSHTRNVPVKRIDRDERGQEKIRESVELDEAFKVGMLKLNDGGSVILKKEDVDVLNGLFKSLSSTNRKKMESTAMKDKNGFNEILSFAREAI
jgi:hypothetical protein